MLVDALSLLADKIKLAAVFGSMANGRAGNESDIDLLLIGDLSFTDAIQALHPAQEVLAREINPKLYKEQDWLAAKQENSSFVRDILDKPKIFVIGGQDDLE